MDGDGRKMVEEKCWKRNVGGNFLEEFKFIIGERNSY
jgi:hypothetical protein